jgi:hypothetical protein
MRKFESSRPGQPVPTSRVLTLLLAETRVIGSFCNAADCLQTPDLTKSKGKLPKVSGQCPEYSRFWEPDAGELFRSPLRGAGYSPIKLFSASDLRELGISHLDCHARRDHPLMVVVFEQTTKRREPRVIAT